MNHKPLTTAALALSLIGGCATRIPPAPPIADYTWTVERQTLPDATLRVLHVATMTGLEKRQIDGGAKVQRTIPCSVLVLEHPTEGLILIDSGYGRRTAADPKDYPGAISVRMTNIKMDAHGAVADRLADIELEPSDVKHIVITHLHHDHAGGIEDFPDATLWMDEREWVAGTRTSLFHGYDPRPYITRQPSFVRFWGTEPYGPFPAHVDLFDDESIILLPSSGHTPGSIAVLINLPRGSFLYTGDTAWNDANWQIPAPKGRLARTVVEANWRENMNALWRIRDWHQKYPDLTIIAGHEPQSMTRFHWPEEVIAPK